MRGYLARRTLNWAMLGLCGLATALTIGLLLAILGYVVVRGFSHLSWAFLTSPPKPLGEVGGGMRNEIIGTGILVGLAGIIALPLGLLAGVYLSEFGGRVGNIVRFTADVLSGLPSVAVGIVAYALLVRPMGTFSAFSGAVALAIIAIPIIARTAEESLRLVPRAIREAALALGIPRWRAIVHIVIPTALTGIISGLLLAGARIAGETAPLIFTALGSRFAFSGLDKPVAALPLQIWRYAISPYEEWQGQAWAASLVLVVLVLAISLGVRFLASRRRV